MVDRPARWPPLAAIITRLKEDEHEIRRAPREEDVRLNVTQDTVTLRIRSLSGRKSIMISKIVRAGILTFIITVPASNIADARTPYDGSWSLSIVTQSGDCAPTYQFELQIIDGIVSYQGPANVRGRVSSGGEVSVSVSTERQQASGSGKLSRNSGRGRWTGRSSGERCSGSWTAQRH